MSDRKFVRNALRLEARHKGVKESAYVRKSWNELQIEKIGATARLYHIWYTRPSTCVLV